MAEGALSGRRAIRHVEQELGVTLTSGQRRVVQEEGYVPHNYDDATGKPWGSGKGQTMQGVKTYGVGQTGEWITRGFIASYDEHENRVENLIDDYDTLPQYLKDELVQSAYRGDITGSPTAVRLFNEGKYSEAADEFLNNDDYRNTPYSGVRNRIRSVAHAMRKYGKKKAAAAKAKNKDKKKSFKDMLMGDDKETVESMNKLLDDKAANSRYGKFLEEYGNIKEDYPWRTLAASVTPGLGDAIGQADLAEAKEEGDVGALDVLGALPLIGAPARFAKGVKGGWSRFDNDKLKMLMSNVKGHKSRDAVVSMDPKDFEKMAADIIKKEGGELDPFDRQVVDHLKENWDPAKADIPYLEVDNAGKVIGHEGRHRAIAMQELGVEQMPVRVQGRGLRWDQQGDAKNFDYMEDYPTKMLEENTPFVRPRNPSDPVMYNDGPELPRRQLDDIGISQQTGYTPRQEIDFPIKRGESGVVTQAQPPTDIASVRPYAPLTRSQSEGLLEEKWGTGRPNMNLIMDLRDKVKGMPDTDQYDSTVRTLDFIKKNSPDLHRQRLDELKAEDPLAIPYLWEKGKLADEDFQKVLETWWPE